MTESLNVTIINIFKSEYFILNVCASSKYRQKCGRFFYDFHTKVIVTFDWKITRLINVNKNISLLLQKQSITQRKKKYSHRLFIPMNDHFQSSKNHYQSEHSIGRNTSFKQIQSQQFSHTQRNPIFAQQVNKLPLNIFLSPAEYNKMLATNGKSRRKETYHISEGYLIDLEFVNDHIFQTIELKKALAKQVVKTHPKLQNKTADDCTCCCCNQFCSECSNEVGIRNKLSLTEASKAKNQIDRLIAKAKNGSKVSLKSSNKKRTTSRKTLKLSRSQSALSGTQKSKEKYNHQSLINYSQGQRSADISHLIIKSLIDFEKSKRKQASLKKQSIVNKIAQQQFLSQLNQKIRKENFSASKRSKSLPKSKSKAQLSKQYWNQIKQDVLENLKNDNYSAALKKQLANFQYHVYEHKDIPKKEVKYSAEQIHLLRLRHEQQAKKEIQKEIKQKKSKAKKIKKNLKSLEKQRIQHLQSLTFKPFKPTKQMVNSAFQNIVEPNQKNREICAQSTKQKPQQMKKQSKKKL